MDAGQPWVLVLHLFGGSSPLIATVVHVLVHNKWQEFRVRLVGARHLGLWPWMLAISPIGVVLLSQLVMRGEVRVSATFLEQGMWYAFLLLFFGPLPEELGWRGVLFPELAKRHRLVVAQGVTALVWWVWHLPLFFIVGTYQEGLGFGSTLFLVFSLSLVAQSWVMGYLMRLGRYQVGLAVLFHYLVNLMGEMLVDHRGADWMALGLYVGLVLVLIWRHREPREETGERFRL
jgi:membrane protease YdiL (CAAX protease family)